MDSRFAVQESEQMAAKLDVGEIPPWLNMYIKTTYQTTSTRHSYHVRVTSCTSHALVGPANTSEKVSCLYSSVCNRRVDQLSFLSSMPGTTAVLLHHYPL